MRRMYLASKQLLNIAAGVEFGTLASSPAGLAASRCQPTDRSNVVGNKTPARAPTWQRDAAKLAGEDASAPALRAHARNKKTAGDSPAVRCVRRTKKPYFAF